MILSNIFVRTAPPLVPTRVPARIVIIIITYVCIRLNARFSTRGRIITTTTTKRVSTVVAFPSVSHETVYRNRLRPTFVGIRRTFYNDTRHRSIFKRPRVVIGTETLESVET